MRSLDAWPEKVLPIFPVFVIRVRTISADIPKVQYVVYRFQHVAKAQEETFFTAVEYFPNFESFPRSDHEMLSQLCLEGSKNRTERTGL